MTTKLRPVSCGGCGAPIPLAVPSPRVTCRYCGAVTELPREYVEAADIRRREGEARRRAEPLWRRLSGGAPPWAKTLGLVLLVALPPVLSLVAWLIPPLRLGVAHITALVGLPAILPGAGVWLWALAVSATTARFTSALAAARSEEGNRPLCRSCGAPLEVEEGALCATCGYCGTDSLLEEIPVNALARQLGEAMSSLGEAAHRLRARRAILGLGTAAAVLLVAAASVLLWVALLHVA